ncbi:hypothetical protein [Sphingomonas sp. Ag1]|jgi:hypothetical protein|uniref:hypothetical protein n=1 Tax=Sphingomonas sp. Ag1 TaxID=1642949 RepID=UPI0006212065|nr:hypothetical protein [Sphingomonas sp. Ag1]KKI17959.1 hypothetical protein XM50_17345 [Sphingomonas sp. Ag1]
MLTDLETLAADIAHLSRACAELEGTDAALLIGQIVGHLRFALEELADREGMLPDTLPWWTQWSQMR